MKNLLRNEEFQLDEILFQGRNKAYGAYVLRHESDRILTKAMLIGVAMFGTLAVAPIVIDSLNFGTAIKKKRIEVPINIKEFNIPDKAQLPKTIIPAKPPVVNTIDTRIPTPVKDAVNDDPPAKISDYDGAIAGFENIKGDPPVTIFQAPTIKTNPGTDLQKPPVVNKKSVDVADKVDIEADFNGGINIFRNKVVQSFDTSEFEGTGELIKTTVTFIVETDGSISNIKANGLDASFNKEAEKTIRSIKGKWIPAKLKGESVRSYFKFPITMRFE